MAFGGFAQPSRTAASTPLGFSSNKTLHQNLTAPAGNQFFRLKAQ
jgi:hypothetical protein